MRALLADGPLADRELTVAEPFPTLDVGHDGALRHAARIATHRYRLAEVDVLGTIAAEGVERVAVYVHAPRMARGTIANAA